MFSNEKAILGISQLILPFPHFVDRKAFPRFVRPYNNQSFNDMINLTFASFKNPKDPSSIKHHISKKNQIPITSFKAIYDKDKPCPNITHIKRLNNQENTLNNIQTNALPRKNLVKVDKSGKKHNNRGFKSPLNKQWQNSATQSFAEQIQPKLLIKSTLHSKCPPPTIATSRNQTNYPVQTIMTPSLNKNSRSITGDEQFNASFFTQKHSINSDHGSISSNKNSFNDSFHLNANNLSMDEDMNMLDMQEHVNSSMEIRRDASAVVGQFPIDNQFKTMKKSHYFFNTGQSVLKDLDTQSNVSASSITSIKYSQKFKQYKKENQPSIQKKQSGRGFSLRDFKLLCEIGCGKYGKVFLARHLSTGFTCAIKSVSKRIIKQQNLQIPFIREIKIQLYLDHPNIVQLYGIFHDSQNVYLIMEYCSDNHLLKLIKQRKQFSQEEILLVLTNVYEAVSYIHCNGVIHRDIKPQNIVIQHGIYKLCDFGWAAYACGDNRTTFCGTPLYVCPEVLKGEEYNEKADIWGLGIVTYELTFGRVPFSILNQNDLMKIIKDPVYFPVWGQASEILVPLVKKMLSKDPSQRPSLNQILSSQLFTNFRSLPDPNIKKELELLY